MACLDLRMYKRALGNGIICYRLVSGNLGSVIWEDFLPTTRTGDRGGGLIHRKDIFA